MDNNIFAAILLVIAFLWIYLWYRLLTRPTILKIEFNSSKAEISYSNSEMSEQAIKSIESLFLQTFKVIDGKIVLAPESEVGGDIPLPDERVGDDLEGRGVATLQTEKDTAELSRVETEDDSIEEIEKHLDSVRAILTDSEIEEEMRRMDEEENMASGEGGTELLDEEFPDPESESDGPEIPPHLVDEANHITIMNGKDKK